MKTKIQKWGNSLAVRLPKAVTEQKSLHEGAGVLVMLKNDQIVIEPVAEELTLKEILATISPDNLHHEDDWGTEQGNELW